MSCDDLSVFEMILMGQVFMINHFGGCPNPASQWENHHHHHHHDFATGKPSWNLRSYSKQDPFMES